MTSELEQVSAHVCSECDSDVRAAQARCDACGVARPRGGWRLDPHLGRVVAGRYRLLERVGKGGIGRVYRADDVSGLGALGPVVVKLLAQSGGASENRRFANEARAARQLTSPHAVKIYDFGFDDGSPYLVMEVLRGETVRELLTRQKRFEPQRVVEIALQICRALGEAHAAGIVHRDLKPENLMLLAPEHRFVKVLDFGAAHLSGIDATQSVIGTPRYMAPEQILEQELDGRADVYALGACLFEMLTGRPPFEATTVAGCLNAHLNELVPKVRALAPDSPPALAALIERMLAKKPAERPSSMTAVEQALSRPSERTRASRARLAVFAILVAAVTIGVLWFRSEPSAVLPSADHDRVSRPSLVPSLPAPPQPERAEPLTRPESRPSRPRAALVSPAAPPSASAAPAAATTTTARSGTLAEHEF